MWKQLTRLGVLAGAAVVLAAASSGATPAQRRQPRVVISQDTQKEVAITIYNRDLGLVKDIREVSLPEGAHEIKFMDVAAQIDPTTVHLKSLTDSAALRILEQNYEYDLLNPKKLMDKYVGKSVKLMTSDGSLVDAALLSNNGGPIYQIDGQIHIGHPGRLILPDVPGGLIARPTLVWLLQNGVAPQQRVEASYLTRGITWKADYVMIIDATDSRGDLSGWVTIDNRSGATYGNAVLKLVAGDLHRAGSRQDVYDSMRELAAKPAQPHSGFKEEGLFEYHLYSLQGRTTVKDNQTKQISLLDAVGIPLLKELRYLGSPQYYRSQYGTPLSNQKVSVFLEIANTEANRLGIPLPKGIIRAYKADRDGGLQFIGEDTIDHTPKDETVKIKMGEAFDVVGERTQRDWRKIASGVYEAEWEIQLRNHKQEAVQVTILEPVPGDWHILKSSHPYEKHEAHTLKYKVGVPEDGKTTVAYRVRMTW
ncbi:MAG: DUF4139 domain-containing protein [Acidobacteria bacterium]|nr:DUF4139 domain-containing protein [Acidobacteriota bacterium]